MKKLLVSLNTLIVLGLFVPVFAQEFSYLDDLTPVQKQKLTQFNYSYEQNVKSLDMRIDSFKAKINQLKEETDKTADQINLLTSAYERNMSVLNSQKEQLKKQLEKQYESVMTPEQYKQYLTQQLQAKNAFSDFINK